MIWYLVSVCTWVYIYIRSSVAPTPSATPRPTVNAYRVQRAAYAVFLRRYESHRFYSGQQEHERPERRSYLFLLRLVDILKHVPLVYLRGFFSSSSSFVSSLPTLPAITVTSFFRHIRLFTSPSPSWTVLSSSHPPSPSPFLLHRHGWSIRKLQAANAGRAGLLPAHLVRIIHLLRRVPVAVEYLHRIRRAGASARRSTALLALRKVRRDHHTLPRERGLAGRQF